MGNPPFVGSRLADADQKDDQELVWAGNNLQGKLDYVTNWFKLAADYIDGRPTRVAFVATNSITQGEQPAVLWRELYERAGLSIDFAHATFAWSSEASGSAAVHVVIIGFSTVAKPTTRPLWVYPDPAGPAVLVRARNISPYLTDGPDVVVQSRQSPLVEGVPPILFGSMPRDNGHLSNIPPDVAVQIRLTDPLAAKYLHRLIGADELINGSERYCLWLVGADPSEVAASPVLRQRLDAVRQMRLESRAASTRALAATPGLFAQIAQPQVRYLAVPAHSSESRRYLPMAFFDPDVIASNALLLIPGADEALFGLLSSSMFMAWNRTISGRLESRIRVSQEITYNNFPFPEITDGQLTNLTAASSQVLTERQAHPGTSLANLYNPLAMPPGLVHAHDELDRVVDGLFAPRRRFELDAERLAVLLERYEKLSSPLLATITPPKSRRARR